MKPIINFEESYLIAKDYTIIETATGDVVKPTQDARGVLYVKLKGEYGEIKRLKLKELYKEHYTEEGIDNDDVNKVKEVLNSGVLNARVIARQLGLPLLDVQIILQEVKNENREN